MKFVTGITTTTCRSLQPHPVTNNFGRRPTTRARRRHVPRGAGLSPSTERHSASQATAGSEQPGHAVAGGAARAAISWASSPPVRSPMHLRPGMWSPVSLRGDSRPSRGSAALTFPTSGFSTERVGGPHAWSQMHGRLRRRAEEDCSPAFVPRAASAERYDSTCYRVTRCETGHSCCRAAHWRTACVPCVWCD